MTNRFIALALFGTLLFGSWCLAATGREPDLDRAADLLNRAGELQREGRYAEAAPLAEEALALREKHLGRGHQDVWDARNSLAYQHYALKKYDRAEALYARILADKEKSLGADHPEIAFSLNNLALIHHSRGEYARAEPLYLRALAIEEKYLGPEDQHVAVSLNNLAAIYKATGRFEKAESFYARARAIYEQTLAPDHPRLFVSLNNLAGLYRTMGDYERAEPLYQRSLKIAEKAYGPGHPRTAVSLNNLGLLYSDRGEYARAMTLFRRSLDILEKIFGPDHPRLTGVISNLAGLYFKLGDLVKAESLYRKAMAIDSKVHGPEHQVMARHLNSLAVIYKTAGVYDRAEPLYRKALAINERVYRPDHPTVATSLGNLALLNIMQGEYAKAREMLERVLDIDRKAYGNHHPSVALDLNNLAAVFELLGDFDRAGATYAEALDATEVVYGPDHPDVGRVLGNMAQLYARRGDDDTAYAFFRRAQAIDSKSIDGVLDAVTEERKAGYLATRRAGLDMFLNLVARHRRQDAGARRAALDVWLRRKGMVLEAQRRFREALVYSDDPQAVQTFLELARVRSLLSTAVFKGPGNVDLTTYRDRLSALKKRKRGLEEKLAGLSRAFARREELSRADVRAVAAALPPGSVLVEFARVRSVDFQDKPIRITSKNARYLAFVLPAGNDGTPALIDLGDAETIDGAVANFKKSLTAPDDPKGERAEDRSRKLGDRIFEPIRKELAGAKEIFISPDGNLNLIPFEVLRGPDGRYLIEDFTFFYLTSGRDVVGFGRAAGETGKPLIVGDPDFDLETVTKVPPLTKGRRSADMRGMRFTRLPGTLQEVRAIEFILGPGRVDMYTGREAVEDVLIRRRKPPRILHLATHCFFLSDRHIEALAGRRDLSLVSGKDITPVRFENPLLRSGLALAGANYALLFPDVSKTDGLLTAEKVLGLRLWGTRLVVLSACNTGLGEVKNGEGVYGLRRAFMQAGAGSLVMSLWPIPDEETKELMINFYRNLKAGDMNRGRALRRAALSQMKTVKERYGHTHPLYWGAFIFLGEP